MQDKELYQQILVPVAALSARNRRTVRVGSASFGSRDTDLETGCDSRRPTQRAVACYQVPNSGFCRERLLSTDELSERAGRITSFPVEALL